MSTKKGKSNEQLMQDSRDEKRRLEKQTFIASIVFFAIGISTGAAFLLWARDTAIFSIAEKIAP